MENLAAALDAITEELAETVAPRDLTGLADEPLLQLTAAIERLGRRVDALRTGAAGEIAEHSRSELGKDGLAAKKGCRTATELVERVTGVATDTAHRRIKIGTATRVRFSIAGERLPAAFSQVAAALDAGQIGLDSSYVIVRGLSQVAGVAGHDRLESAELELVAAATGNSPECPVPCSAEDTRIHTDTWQRILDQDGTEPPEERAMRKRGFRLGREQDGVVPISGALLTDIAAKFQAVFDACMSPKTAPAFLAAEELAAQGMAKDPRTPDQQRHDILAGVISIAARSGELSSHGGSEPVVLVSVRQRDLETGRGVGFIGDVPISMRAVKQFTCTGGKQKVIFDDDGRIIVLGSPQRCFTPNQRKAITLRDGGCCVPGCRIPAAWCEIHHVDPAANDGETHTDNGILLCWFHHRTLETSGWEFRMNGGVPEVKYPPWLDQTGTWYRTPQSRTRQLDVKELELV
jgi:Domain of unknown function DUF222.